MNTILLKHSLGSPVKNIVGQLRWPMFVIDVYAAWLHARHWCVRSLISCSALRCVHSSISHSALMCVQLAFARDIDACAAWFQAPVQNTLTRTLEGSETTAHPKTTNSEDFLADILLRSPWNIVIFIINGIYCNDIYYKWYLQDESIQKNISFDFEKSFSGAHVVDEHSRTCTRPVLMAINVR